MAAGAALNAEPGISPQLGRGFRVPAATRLPRRAAGEPSARTRNRHSSWVEASHGAAAGAGGIVRFYSPFLTLFVSETEAGMDRGSPGRRMRQEPLGRARVRGWFCRGEAMAKGFLPRRPPSLLRFNLLVIGFN